MDPTVNELLNLAFRWIHVFVAILWIGQTAFFAWLDARMNAEADPETGKERVWMVHSGGFYVVDKQKTPEILPRELHWFRWEAAITWLSGFLLLGMVYYMGGLLVEIDGPVSRRAAMWIGLGSLAVGWIVYDLLWTSPLARRSELAAAAISVALLVGATWGLSQVMTGRAAFIHAGAILGTVMTANVWMRILPAQRRMIEAARTGGVPDPALAERAKSRSRHNTFMAVPVTLLMISNHFPTTTYGHDWNWLLLGGYLLLGFFARWLMNLHNAARARPKKKGA